MSDIDDKLKGIVEAKLGDDAEVADDSAVVENGENTEENLFEEGAPETDTPEGDAPEGENAEEAKKSKGKGDDCDDEDKKGKGKGKDITFVGGKGGKSGKAEEAEKDPSDAPGDGGREKMVAKGADANADAIDPNDAKGKVDNPLPNHEVPVIVDAKRDAFPSIVKAGMASAGTADVTKGLKSYGEQFELSDEAMEAIKPIFDGAVLSRSEKAVETMAKLFQEDYDARIVEMKRELAESVDSFINYISEKWMKDNELSLTQSIRDERANAILEGFRDVLLKNNVDIPAGAENLVDQQATKIAFLESKLNDATGELLAEREKNFGELKDKIIGEVAKARKLSEAQVDKATTAMESVEWNGSESFKATVEEYFDGIDTSKVEATESTIDSGKEANLPKAQPKNASDDVTSFINWAGLGSGPKNETPTS